MKRPQPTPEHQQAQRTLLDRVRSGDTLLADGALGSLLMERGLEPGHAPEEFCLTRPEALREIVKLYQDAGAEIFQANTFGASRLKLEQYGLADRLVEINWQAVKLVREVVGDQGYVWASVGPAGRLLKPYGDVDPAQMYDSFLEQIRVLADAGADIIAIETMTDLAEAKIALSAAAQVNLQVPLITATLTFEKRKKGFFTIMGNSISDAASTLADADMLGSNCGNGTEAMIEIAREFRRATDKPLVIRPNAGLPVIRNGAAVYPETPEYMAERLPGLLGCGLGILGGCCGTTPGHIHAFRRVLDAAPGRST